MTIKILEASGFSNASALVAAAEKVGLPLWVATAMVEKESMGKNVYGHDAGGIFSVAGKNIPVTEANYKEFLTRLAAGEKSNGVGPTQITWPGFFPDAARKGLKLWIPHDNFVYGFTLLASYLKGSYSDASVKSAGTRYNGKEVYGTDFLAKAKKWKQKLATEENNTMSYTLTTRWVSKYSGTGDKTSITIHHWDDPSKGPTFEGTVSWLARADVKASVHYIAEAGRVCQMLSEDKNSWHAGVSTGNATSISIECNPRCTDGDLETVAQLIADIWKRQGRLPLRPHKSWKSTSCPGRYEAKLGWLAARAAEILDGKPADPKPPVTGGKSATEVAREVIAGKWGNGPDRVSRLRAAGYDPVAVQAEVNRLLGTPTTPPKPVLKSATEVAREVIAGKWGNGPDRVRRLRAAGYDPVAVQAEVNRLLGASTAPVRKTVSQVADEVIAGKWGNGDDRVRRLRAAGYDPVAVQAEVNRKSR